MQEQPEQPICWLALQSAVAIGGGPQLLENVPSLLRDGGHWLGWRKCASAYKGHTCDMAGQEVPDKNETNLSI